MKKSLRYALSLFLAVTVMLSPWTAFGVAPAEAEAREPIVVSLGDSFSSGEGVEDFYGQDKKWNDKKDDPDWLAHRSMESWPGKLLVKGITGPLSENRNKSWYFFAASGAVISNLYTEQKKEYNRNTKGEAWLRPQLDQLKEVMAQHGHVDYITLTLGGNDADFVGVITEAAMHRNNMDNSYLAYDFLGDKLDAVWHHFWEKGGIRDSLRQAYIDIAAATGYDYDRKRGGAHIFVAGYPMLLEPGAKTVGNFYFNETEIDRINGNIVSFNEEIEKIVEEVRDYEGVDIEFVPVIEAFRGHGAYADKPFINKVDLSDENEDLDKSVLTSSYSIHPNIYGIDAYRSCVQLALMRYEDEKDMKSPASVALRDFLKALVDREYVLPTDSLPAAQQPDGGYVPGWTPADLTGLLTASIASYDDDMQEELLTVSMVTEPVVNAGLYTSVVLRMYEYLPQDGRVELTAEKKIRLSNAFMRTESLSEQINVMDTWHDRRRIVVLDDCRTMDDMVEVTLAGYRYNGKDAFEYLNGIGYYENGENSATVFEADDEGENNVLDCAGEETYGTAWRKAYASFDGDMEDEEEVYYFYVASLYRLYSLIGEDQRLFVNQSYIGYSREDGLDNGLRQLTARDVYADDEGGINHLGFIHNCYFDDRHPVKGSAWWLRRGDDIGLLDERREKGANAKSRDQQANQADPADVGQWILFGAYAPYDGMEGTVKAPIRWRVLDVKDGNMLLFSEDILEASSFGDPKMDNGAFWAKSYMRTWDLENIYKAAFTDEEKARILTTAVHNGGEADTLDKLFLLSAEEAARYLPNEEDRIAFGTESARVRGWLQEDHLKRAYWWTRTCGDSEWNNCIYVAPDGRIDEVGQAVSYSFYGIRPAMWVVPWKGMEIVEGKTAAQQLHHDPASDDSEDALTDLLKETYPGEGDLLVFGYADYDGDGEMEGFAMMGEYDDSDFRNEAELWYVCQEFAVQCELPGGCYPFDCYVTEQDGRTCFHVSEGYFGSGGAERYWTAEAHRPRLLSGDYMLMDLHIR